MSEGGPEQGTDAGVVPGGRGVQELEELYRSGMLRRFGPLYYLSGAALALHKLRFEEHSAENVRSAAAAGPVVYVLHTKATIDWLALNVVLNRRRLPLSRFTPGLRSTWLKPFRRMFQEWVRSIRRRLEGERLPDPLASGYLAEAVGRGMPSAIFLLRGRSLWGRTLGGDPDPVELLVKAQERLDRPIQLVPVVVVWNRAPVQARTEVGRIVLGAQDEPGPLQKLWMVLNRSADAVVQAGAPVDLRELLERFQHEPPRRRVRAARILLRRYLHRESRVVRGPGIRPYRWMRHLVMTSPQVRRLVDQEALATGRSQERIQAEIERMLDQMAARLSWPVMRMGRVVLNLLWNRMYSGIDIRDEDLERIREAVRSGSAVLVPCHRSHLDYMLLSSVLFEHDITIPHVIAGDNLSFWPLGPILRRSGAVFIKRKFQGDRVFPVVFERYLAQLLKDAVPVEFFIEGGRSRTGKLLPPKLGVLRMVLDSGLTRLDQRELTLLPVGISYELVAEAGAYQQEMGGKPKQVEDLSQLARAGRVLRKRYGRVYIRVGEPVRGSDILGGGGHSWEEHDRDHRRELLQQTGERLMHRIAESMVILPTGLAAMALLAGGGPGIRHSHLHSRVQRFDRLLRHCGALPAVTMTYGGWALDQALERFSSEKWIGRVADETGDLIFQIMDEHRTAIAYAKNGLVHFVAPLALAAAAIAAVGEPDSHEVDELFRFQVFVLRYEVTLDPEVSLNALLERARERLTWYGALEETESGRRIVEPKLLAEVAGTMRDLLESYLVTLRAAQALRSRDIPEGELPARIREVGKGLRAVDEVRRTESLALPNLVNAVRAFKEEGVIELRPGAGLRIEDSVRDTYVAALTRLLG